MQLKAAALLDGFSGAPKADVEALAAALVKHSQLAPAAGDSLQSIDLDPFVVLPQAKGAVALDAVVLGRGAAV